MDNIDWKDKLGAAFGVDPAQIEEDEPESVASEPAKAATGRLDVIDCGL